MGRTAEEEGHPWHVQALPFTSQPLLVTSVKVLTYIDAYTWTSLGPKI